jgi:hypothetical protein
VRKLIAPLVAVAIALVGSAAPATPPIEAVDNVAVIVVDDFKPERGEKPRPRSEGNCTYSPEHANDVTSHGAGDGLPAGVSHGDAVYARLADELTDTSGLEPIPTQADDDARWKYHGKEIVLTRLDTGTFDTTELADRLRAKVDAMSAGPTRFRRFVLNLSFVIAPCNVPKWLRDHHMLDTDYVIALYRGLVEAVPELREFRDTLETLARSPNRDDLLTADDDGLGPIRRLLAVSLFYAYVEQKDDALVTWIQSDPLRTRIVRLLGNGNRVISVGAAGNGIWVPGTDSEPMARLRLPFPFAPALWNPVVSASASGESAKVRASFSNSGEVLLDGRTSIAGGDVRGTSFAAPRLSAKEAAYLLTGGEVSCASSFPPLGYTNSDLTGQSWLDLSVAQAAFHHCPGFLRPLVSP